MKNLILFLAFAAFFFPTVYAATSQKLMSEMEDYARDLVRKHPEVVGDKKKKEYREDMVKQAGQAGVFELSKDQEKLLRRRKEIVPNDKFQEMLSKMKALNSKDPKVTFLISYAENDRIKAVEKVLAYRLMQRDYAKAAEKAANERGKHMHTVLQKYVDYKQTNSKPPASLSDLGLPEESKKFTNSKGEKVDWIYIGHLGPRLKTNNSHVVLIAPEPAGDARACGLDNGEIVRFKNSSVQGHIDKIVKSMNDGTATPTGGGGSNVQTGSGSSQALSAIMKRIKIYKELNNDKLPSSLSDLKIAPEHKNYTDPASGEKLAWIYLGANSRIRVGENTKVIIVAPKANGDKRLAALSDGRIITIPEKQIGPALK